MPWLDSQPLAKSKQPPTSQPRSVFLHGAPGDPSRPQDLPGSLVVGPWNGPWPSGLCGHVGSRLAPGFSLSLTMRVPAHQPTALSAFFTEPTITSLSPLDAHSIPQVPPSQLCGVKRSPTAATWGMGAPGPKQRAGASEGEPHQDSNVSLGSTLGVASPFRCCCFLLCSCMKEPSSVWHEYGRPRNEHHALPLSSKRKSEGRSCCIEGGSPGCSTLSPSAELLRSSPWNLAILCDLPLNPECLGH